MGKSTRGRGGLEISTGPIGARKEPQAPKISKALRPGLVFCINLELPEKGFLGGAVWRGEVYQDLWAYTSENHSPMLVQEPCLGSHNCHTCIAFHTVLGGVGSLALSGCF